MITLNDADVLKPVTSFPICVITPLGDHPQTSMITSAFSPIWDSEFAIIELHPIAESEIYWWANTAPPILIVPLNVLSAK